MLAFPTMLVSAAEEAGIKVPPDPDDFDAKAFPHFAVFCNAQLGRPMSAGAHWGNAFVVAKIPDDQIQKITVADLLNLGWQY